MSSFLLAVVVIAAIVGAGVLLTRRRTPPIERGIREFSREMQALAPRHPSEGPPRKSASPPVDPAAPAASDVFQVDPSTDDLPEGEA